ncbi:Coenzyme F420 hydrogenase/dehydrogenase, beta subunit C-terminal domain [Candidatus Bathyarchaeota archaeon]|nr:Coenzyme F420 hydrogenase/dehydrogenase, beta subunit C-terminal domain [Candidatus Bathyarchaeota archaeon]
MSIQKISFEESLEKIVSDEKCMGCAACVVCCPLNSLEYVEGKPKLVGKCTACGICAQLCPQYALPRQAMEKFVFGREKTIEEDFGIYRRIVIARTTDERILQVCQDGGVVSTLLTVALKNGIINGAVVSGISNEKPFYPVPKLVTNPEEVLECAGTRYSYSPNMLAFREGVKDKEAKLAFVGTPCQINVIRNMQMLPLKKYAKALDFTIGLMCTETFTYEGLMEKHIQGVMGIDLQNVTKINIKGKILVATKSNEVKGIPLKVAKQYARKTCDLCTDFSSELADISTGGLGMTGWTLTILRTKKGEEMFEYAQRKGLLEIKPVEQEKRAVNLLIRLSKLKRRKQL